jgi:hypothetical protein
VFGLGDVDERIQNWLFDAKTSLTIEGYTLLKISWMLDVVALIGFNSVRLFDSFDFLTKMLILSLVKTLWYLLWIQSWD